MSDPDVCPLVEGQALLSNSQLRTDFSDRATLRRVVGFLYWLPVFGGPEDPVCTVPTFPVEARIGLRKGTSLEGLAGASLPDPFDDLGLSESQWKHVWTQLWAPHRECHGETIGQFCSNPNGATVHVSTDAGGNPEWICRELTPTVQTVQPGVVAPPMVRFAVDWRGRMPLRENEFVELITAWASLGAPVGQRLTSVIFGGHLRLLMEF